MQPNLSTGVPLQIISTTQPLESESQRKNNRAAARAARAAARNNNNNNNNNNGKSTGTLGYDASFLASESTRFFGKSLSQNGIGAEILQDDAIVEEGGGGGLNGSHREDSSRPSSSTRLSYSKFDISDKSSKKLLQHQLDASAKSGRISLDGSNRLDSSNRLDTSNKSQGRSTLLFDSNNNINRRSTPGSGERHIIHRSGRRSEVNERTNNRSGLSHHHLHHMDKNRRSSDYGPRGSNRKPSDTNDRSNNMNTINRMLDVSDSERSNMSRKRLDLSEKSGGMNSGRLSGSGHSRILETGQDTAQTSSLRLGRSQNQGQGRININNNSNGDGGNIRTRAGPFVNSQKSRESYKSSDDEGGMLTPMDIEVQYERLHKKDSDGGGSGGVKIQFTNSGKSVHPIPLEIISDQAAIDWGDGSKRSYAPMESEAYRNRSSNGTRSTSGTSGSKPRMSGSGISPPVTKSGISPHDPTKERLLDVANMDDDIPKVRVYNERGEQVRGAGADTDSVFAVKGPVDGNQSFGNENDEEEILNIQTFRTKSNFRQKSQRPQDALPLVDESNRSGTSNNKLESMKSVLIEERNRQRYGAIDGGFHKKRGFCGWRCCGSGQGDSIRNVRKRRSRKRCMILLSVLVLILSGVAAALWFLVFQKPDQGDVSIVENMSMADANPGDSENSQGNSTGDTDPMTNSTSNNTFPPGNSSDVGTISSLNSSLSPLFLDNTTSLYLPNNTLSTNSSNVTTDSHSTNTTFDFDASSSFSENATFSMINNSSFNEWPSKSELGNFTGETSLYPTFSFTYMPTFSPTVMNGNFSGGQPTIAPAFFAPTYSPAPSTFAAPSFFPTVTNGNFSGGQPTIAPAFHAPTYSPAPSTFAASNGTQFPNATYDDVSISNASIPLNLTYFSESNSTAELAPPFNSTAGNVTVNDNIFINATVIETNNTNFSLNASVVNETISTIAVFPTNDTNITDVGYTFPLNSTNPVDTNIIDILSSPYKLSLSMMGEYPSSRFGTCVAISSDGRLIAVGATEATNTAGESTGAVFIYAVSESEWVKSSSSPTSMNSTLLDVLYGISSGDEFGSTIALSNDGTRIVVGSRSESEQVGAIRVYEQNDATNTWEMMGDAIMGQTEMGRFGWAVDISGDGNIIAVGSPTGGNSQGGLVATYQFDEQNESWQPYSSAIEGVSGESLGFSVQLSYDGSTLAVGSPKASNSVGSSNAGKTAIYYYSDDWTPLAEVYGEAAEDNDGTSVAISQDGLTLVTGAKGRDGNDGSLANSGYCRIYEFKDNAGFELIHTMLGGNAEERMGSYVTSSLDGHKIACGGTNGYLTGLSAPGVVRLWNRSTFQEIEIWPRGDRDAQYEGAAFGSSIAISADGKNVVIGAPAYSTDNSGAMQGMIQFFDKHEALLGA